MKIIINDKPLSNGYINGRRLKSIWLGNINIWNSSDDKNDSIEKDNDLNENIIDNVPLST